MPVYDKIAVTDAGGVSELRTVSVGPVQALARTTFFQIRTGMGIVEVHSCRKVLEQENPNSFSQLFQPTATVIISW